MCKALESIKLVNDCKPESDKDPPLNTVTAALATLVAGKLRRMRPRHGALRRYNV